MVTLSLALLMSRVPHEGETQRPSHETLGTGQVLPASGESLDHAQLSRLQATGAS